MVMRQNETVTLLCCKHTGLTQIQKKSAYSLSTLGGFEATMPVIERQRTAECVDSAGCVIDCNIFGFNLILSYFRVITHLIILMSVILKKNR
jgi:hypothetical protein